MDKGYSLMKLANDLHTNTRYITAVLQWKHHKTYKDFINQLRVEKAKELLQTSRYASLTEEEIALLVGFSNRQSFYRSFLKYENKSFTSYKKDLKNTF